MRKTNSPVSCHGPLQAVIFDFVGAVIDYGSCAPAATFVEVFRRFGVEITAAEAREPLGLTWPDVDWEHDRITVYSPKTEHHPGGESRVIPLFSELRTYLEEVFEQAEPGTRHVITRYRGSNSNLRTQLNRIIR